MSTSLWRWDVYLGFLTYLCGFGVLPQTVVAPVEQEELVTFETSNWQWQRQGVEANPHPRRQRSNFLRERCCGLDRVCIVDPLRGLRVSLNPASAHVRRIVICQEYLHRSMLPWSPIVEAAAPWVARRVMSRASSGF